MAAAEQHHTLVRPSFDAPVTILIVVAPYYKDIADQLVAGAQAEIEAANGQWELVEVPGALEVPTAIAIAHRRAEFDGYVAWAASSEARQPTTRQSATTASARCSFWAYRAPVSAMAF